MKYRKVTIFYDNGRDLRNIKNINEVARKSGVDRGWLSKALRDKTILSEAAYLKVKKVLAPFS